MGSISLCNLRFKCNQVHKVLRTTPGTWKALSQCQVSLSSREFYPSCKNRLLIENLVYGRGPIKHPCILLKRECPAVNIHIGEVTANGRSAKAGKKAGLWCQYSKHVGHLDTLPLGGKDLPEQKNGVMYVILGL